MTVAKKELLSFFAPVAVALGLAAAQKISGPRLGPHAAVTVLSERDSQPLINAADPASGPYRISIVRENKGPRVKVLFSGSDSDPSYVVLFDTKMEQAPDNAEAYRPAFEDGDPVLYVYGRPAEREHIIKISPVRTEPQDLRL